MNAGVDADVEIENGSGSNPTDVLHRTAVS